MIKLVSYSLIIILMLSCKQKDTEIPVIHLSKTPDKDGVIRDIPPNYATADFEKMHHLYEQGLGLNPIRNGFDQLQIRVWEQKGLSDTGRLYVIKEKADVWTMELYYTKDIFDKGYTRRE